MNSMGNTLVQTVAGHLVSVYHGHGLEFFQFELELLINRILESTDYDSSALSSILFRLGMKILEKMDLSEHEFDCHCLAIIHNINAGKGVMEKCIRFRKVILSCLSQKDSNTKLAVRTRNYLKNCTLDQLKALNTEILADSLSVSRSYLSRCCHRFFGYTLSEMITSERIKRAFDLLGNRETDYKVWQVAEMVGYQNIHVFRKVFKQYSGLDPGRVRQLEHDQTGGRL
ncbi:MAG: helix-turn-helix domain-containing protein [Acidobacteria bacterium]|nr:helix-turn-helix domain-containing protein [Acidobacteriota bacterium]